MLQQLPFWVLTGILVFPLVGVMGVVGALICPGEVNPLFSLILPSILFEELFENTFAAISDSILLNFLFAILFWFAVGAATGFVFESILKIKKVRREVLIQETSES